VPGLLAKIEISPVEPLRESPAGDDVYVPPVVPVLVTGLIVRSLLQKGAPAYDIVAAGACVIVIEVALVCDGQPPAAAIV